MKYIKGTCLMCGNQRMEFNGEQDGLKVKVHSHFGGLHWVYENKKGDQLSVICHSGSYGKSNGLFEIMPSKAPKSWGDSVKGYCTFGEVQKWINKLRKANMEGTE